MKSSILFFFFFSLSITAQTAEELIEKVQQKFDTINTLSADFSQSVTPPHSSNAIKFTGKFFFMKNNNFRIELLGRMIISDGKTVWNFDEKQNKVVVSETISDEVSFSLNDIIYTYPNKCDLSIERTDESGYLIKAVPSVVELSFKVAFFEIDKNYILNKISIFDYNNMKYSFELLSVKLNINLNRDLFSFNPSNKVEVIDLR